MSLRNCLVCVLSAHGDVPRWNVVRALACSAVMWVFAVFVPGLLGADASDALPHDQLTFFETKIRPLLAERCWECHDGDTQEGELRLDSLAAMVQGGDRGPAIKPGSGQQSLLIHAVNHSEADLQMPQGDKLAASEIKDLTRWIDMGAPWPGASLSAADDLNKSPQKDVEGSLFTEEERNFWAFVPPQMPVPPEVRHTGWVQSDLDLFILAKLEQAGLTPAPPATRRSLIRRAYFDLIGLPPTPAQIESFLGDDSPDAFERVVDTLLASPQYGERWGRHWLDVARYADSNGLDENIAFEFIYKYRDWVVRAINDDLPYREFVMQQIAGDLLPRQDHETAEDFIARVTACGFMSVGPKMVADDDPQKKKMDVIDEQLNTLSQAFMGLTLGCARCHDHKFDPIPTWDYYAMAGILKSTQTLEHLRVVSPIALHELKPTGYDEAFAVFDEKLQELTAQREAMLRALVGETYDELVKDPQRVEGAIPIEQRAAWDELKQQLEIHEATRPPLEKIMAPRDGEPEDLPVLLRGNYLTPGEPTRRQFLRIIVGPQPKPIETNGSGRLQLAEWIASPTHPLTARVLVNRVWRWRFGRGIVATPDNFGKLGARPTHPELLDWLSVLFMTEDQWSMKRLHKRMMLSATYQMSTHVDAASIEVDPENQLWWRFPRKRLEAEAIRDALLQVSGGLDLTIGGSMMGLKDHEYVTGTASTTQRYDNPRRSLYQPIYRSAVYDVLTAFDFPDPATINGDRAHSIVAPQALLMMNSGLVEQAATRLAQQLCNVSCDDVARVTCLFEQVYGRPAQDAEITAITSFLESRVEFNTESQTESESKLAAWRSITRAVLSANEFLYLD